MRYIYYLFLGLAPALQAMEAEDTKQPLGERQPIDVHRFAGMRVVYETCLNTDAKDGYSLEETLRIRRNCLRHFVDTNATEIIELKNLGLFAGKIDSYSEEAMTLLDSIFGNNADKENQPSAIPVHFRHHSEDFIKDLNDLRSLVKGTETQPEPIKGILKEMRMDFIYVNWMVVHYSDHIDEYRKNHRFR